MFTFQEMNRLYTELGLSDSQIATQTGIPRRTIGRWRVSLGIKSKRQTIQDSLPQELTPLQDQLLIGTLMGDGHLMCRRQDQSTARLQLVHAEKQREYLKYKVGLLEDYFCNSIDRVEKKFGTEYNTIMDYTRYHPVFAPYYRLFYPEGTKTFRNIVDRIDRDALAFWYFDDGTLEGTGYRIIITSEFRQDVYRIVEMLRDKLGLVVTFRESYAGYRTDSIRICSESSEDFFHNYLKPHLVSCLYHKIPKFLRPDNPEPSRVGNDSEGVETQGYWFLKSHLCVRKRMNKRHRGILIGMVLGDGYVRQAQGSKTCVLQITHCARQKPYLLYKASLLSEIVGNPVRVQDFDNSGYPGVRIAISHKYFRLLRKWLYTEGQKMWDRQRLSWLTPEGIAIWYMDDGSLVAKKRRGKIHAYDLSLSTYTSVDQNTLVADFFQERFGISWGMRKNKGHFLLRMGTREARKFLELVRPFVIPEMEYKVRLDQPIPHSAGHPNNKVEGEDIVRTSVVMRRPKQK